MNGYMDEVAMNAMGYKVFGKAEDFWQLERPLVPHRVELATYKLSLQGES